MFLGGCREILNWEIHMWPALIELILDTRPFPKCVSLLYKGKCRILQACEGKFVKLVRNIGIVFVRVLFIISIQKQQHQEKGT